MNRLQHLAGEPRVAHFDISRQSHGNLLQQPTVAVRIAERSVRGITLPLRTQAVNHAFPISMVEHAARVVERLADLDATTQQFAARSLDVGDDEVQPLD